MHALYISLYHCTIVQYLVLIYSKHINMLTQIHMCI
uniref:Uncharacterized protein n=1 Tax=Anguilla anguilla TaxID=7936 RepID=A0A0E9RNU8_ANGAN